MGLESFDGSFAKIQARWSVRFTRAVCFVGSLTAVACTTPQYGEPLADSGNDVEASGEHRDAGGERALDEAGREAPKLDAGTDAVPEVQRSGMRPSDELAGLIDAAMASSPPDAAVANVETVLPSWGEPLLGTYATQSYSFARDRVYGFVSRVEELELVRVVREGDGAEMRARLCRQVATSEQDELRIVDATRLPEVRRKVLFADQKWSTDAVPWGYGYDRAVPADCVGKENQPIAKRTAQAWLASTCRCPSSAELAPRIDDCRVLDPDGDGKPGLTYRDQGIGLVDFIDFTIYAVYVSRSHLVRGTVKSDGSHYAERVVDEVAYQLECEPAVCPHIADASRPCASQENSAQFARLAEVAPNGEAWTCELLLQRAKELFPNPPPARPGTCTEQALTDDPTRQ